MPIEEVVGHATVLDVNGDVVELDAALPEGDFAYRVESLALPEDGESPLSQAGAPGFAFARVMLDAEGNRMSPSFIAIDIASDNRLLPQASWATTHRFETTCESPQVHARLM